MSNKKVIHNPKNYPVLARDVPEDYAKRVLARDVPEDYAKRVIKQFRAFCFLGGNLPFIINLNKCVAERRALLMIDSNWKRNKISFYNSRKLLQIVPRDQAASDTLEAYFDDFLEWQQELFGKPTLAIDFEDSPEEYVQATVNDIVALIDHFGDFAFSFITYSDSNSEKVEAGFKALKIRPSGFQKERHPKEQYVYFIQAGNEPQVKIGITQRIDQRLKQLQTGSPHPLKVLAVTAGGRKLEQELHEKFKKYSLRGEWFSLRGEVSSYVNKLRSLREE